ncbi:MAG TPA: N-acetylmuramoyl-L-alanine amidase [Opitutaceae bacterium]|nr:N-acetylmuramoyl-L-alanine amidase [Opitutaceae bacterium]
MASLSRWRSSRFIGALALLALGGCATPSRQGDAFIVAGRHVQTGTRVVTWLDAGGLDAYRTARVDESGAPESFGARRATDGKAIAAGDDSAVLGVVDQIVLHYDGFGNSRECFEHLAERQLSAHFLIDVDGTVYQTLDLQERAYHATVANNRSIGIEIANVGAFPAEGDLSALPPGDVIRGTVHRIELVQPGFTATQYAALAKLIDALCRTFPRLERDYPRDAAGEIVLSNLPDDALANFRGVLGHFHIQENKVDPGPAFQWKLIFKR